MHRRDVHGDPDPVFFLGYWDSDDATRAKFTGDPAASWCRTGDTAVMDDDGYLWYQGRSDDIFKAAGYRIGPSEIENCLVKHPAVANAAVVPKPDAERGAVVKAYVVLAAGHRRRRRAGRALQQHVRGRLAPYEYPKEIEFIDALPMTTTGKVQRRVLRLQEARARAGAAALTVTLGAEAPAADPRRSWQTRPPRRRPPEHRPSCPKDPIRIAAALLTAAVATLAAAGCGTKAPTPPRTGFLCYDWKNNPDFTVMTRRMRLPESRDTPNPPPGWG